jgi:hypothetical protein
MPVRNTITAPAAGNVIELVAEVAVAEVQRPQRQGKLQQKFRRSKDRSQAQRIAQR